MTGVMDALRPKFRAQSRQALLLLGLSLLTAGLGLAMVASASAIDSFKQTDSAATMFFRQGAFALVGLIALVAASNLPMGFYRRMSMPILFSALGLQVATVLFGADINGNRNWLDLGFVSIQPSEFLKLALIVALAQILAQLGGNEERNRQLWIWVFLLSGAAVVLVAVMGRDLGTGVVMAVLLMGIYLFAGMRWHNWLLLGFAGLAAAAAMIMASPSRRIRFDAWLNPEGADPMGVRWQFEHGTWALASGGIFGTGLGRSKLKWSWIPEVENDFIFAVIGEELGLVGAGAVILLFFAIGLVLFAIVRLQTDPFNRNIVVGVMFWIVMQAFINIGVVLGLFPVLGVPLPLISAGGSSLIATMLAIGVVLAVEWDRMSHLGRRRS